MAFQAGRQASILVDQYDLSAYFKDMSLDVKVDLGDTTTFGATARSKVALLRDGTVKLSGFWDPTAGSSVAVLSAALAASAASVCSYAPIGWAIGNLIRVLSARESDYSEKQVVTGLIEHSASIEADGGIDYGVSLHTHAAAETTSTNSTSVDNGAATTGGGVAHLHVAAVSGTTPSATIKVQHSADNSTFADLVTFTAATAVGAQRSVVAAGTTVNRYLRAASTITGTVPSFTYAVGFARR